MGKSNALSVRASFGFWADDASRLPAVSLSRLPDSLGTWKPNYRKEKAALTRIICSIGIQCPLSFAAAKWVAVKEFGSKVSNKN
jgi:hypothetical protein